MSSSNETLLGGVDENGPLFQKLMLDRKQVEPDEPPVSKLVAPTPGWCLKTWFKNGTKLFVNVCTSDMVLKPKDLSEEEVREIVVAGDAMKFRVPMGIGEVHKEQDKEGKEVDVYDIVIHPDFLAKCERESFFKEFFVMLVFDGLADKYELELNREYRLLKNRKSIGTLTMQNVRSRSKPCIIEMNPSMVQMEKEFLEEAQNERKEKQDKEKIISEISSSKTTRRGEESDYITPKYTMVQEPEVGYPQYLVFEVELPNQDSVKNILLDVGEDCMIVHAKNNNDDPYLDRNNSSNNINYDNNNINYSKNNNNNNINNKNKNNKKYKLDIDLPFDVDNENTGAQFHRKTKVLSVTLPVLPKKL